MRALHKCISAVGTYENGISWEVSQTTGLLLEHHVETHVESIKSLSLFFSKHKTKQGFSGKQGECLVTNTSSVSLFFNYSITMNNCNIEMPS